MPPKRTPLRGKSQVAIVGAGPAGSAAATVLARAGMDVALFDRANFPRDKVCGDAVSNQGVALLKRLGAADAVLAGPHAKVTCARAILPDGSAIARNYDPPGIIVPRLALDDALRRAAQAAGATLHMDTEVSSLHRREGGQLGYMLRSDPSGRELSWEAEFVIAADGHGSVARAVLGHPKPRHKTLAVGIAAYMRGVEFPAGANTSDHYFEHSIPGGYGWVFPAVDGLSNVGVYQRSDHFGGGGKKLQSMLDAFISTHPERFANASEPHPRRTWPLPIGPTPWSLHAHQLLAAGDAGNHIDPLSGEGIWQALCAGMHAGEIAVAALRSGALSPDLQKAYARRCAQDIRRAHKIRIRIQDAMHRLIAGGWYERAWVRTALRWGYERAPFESSKLH